MYSEYLISISDSQLPLFILDPENNEAPSSQIIDMGGYGSRKVYSDPRKDGNPVSDWGGDAFVLGQWDPNGRPGIIHADYQLFRPLGNEAGVATGDLTAQGRQGWALRAQEWDDMDPENVTSDIYPAGQKPFRLQITREDHTADPVYPGWGWRVDMISDDPTRDITARGIGIYSDDAWQNYLYTTGAFVDDGSGNFYTECPIGQRTANPDPVYFALLLGAAQEGTFTLAEGGDATEAQFWENDQ